MQEMQTKQTDEVTIDIWRLMRALWKRIWLIVIVVAVFGILSYTYSALFITPTYRASFTAYVNNRQTTEGVGSTSSSDLSASLGLARLYAEIITSRSVLTEAAAQCGIEMDHRKLAGMVSTSVGDSVAIITVHVEDIDPVRATELATAITVVAPKHVNQVVVGSDMQIVDAPIQPDEKYSPSNTRNALLGAIVGMVLVVGIIVVIELVNDKVQGSEDLESRYQVPVIGSIPDLLLAEKNRDKYGYRRGGSV